MQLIEIGAKLLADYNPQHLSNIIKKDQILPNLEHVTPNNLIDPSHVNLESTSQHPNPEVSYVNLNKEKLALV